MAKEHEIEKTGEKASEIVNPEVKPRFKGYTLEDLRYQRALVALQKEFCKSRVLRKTDDLRNRKLIGNGKESGGLSRISRYGSLAGKIMSGLSYLDYAMLGMSLFGSGKKIYKFFKGKKK